MLEIANNVADGDWLNLRKWHIPVMEWPNSNGNKQ